MKKPITDLDYVELYARKMKKDNTLFEQQKRLIEAQFKASNSLFSDMFKGKDFQEEARKYLKERGII